MSSTSRVIHHGKNTYVSPINDDLEASARYAFDESGRVQMTPSLQHATVHLNGMENKVFFFVFVFVICIDTRDEMKPVAKVSRQFAKCELKSFFLSSYER